MFDIKQYNYQKKICEVKKYKCKKHRMQTKPSWSLNLKSRREFGLVIITCLIFLKLCPEPLIPTNFSDLRNS